MKPIIFSLALVLICISCDISNSDVSPEYEFVKIFDDPDITSSYYPVDALETSDNGILILSAISNDNMSNYPGIHLIKTSSSGQIIWSKSLETSYVSPMPNILKVGNELRLVCMDDLSFRTKLLSIDHISGEVNEISELSNTYPLAAHYNESSKTTLILSYDGIGLNTVMSGYDDSNNEIFTQRTATNKDFSYEIFQHLKKQRDPFPFFIQSFDVNNISYYAVNAFSNYTLSLLFLEQSSGNISGRVNGYQELGGMGASLHKEEGHFAIVKSEFNTNSIAINPDVEIDVNSTQNISQLNAIDFPELSTSSNFRIIYDDYKGKSIIAYACTTKNNQMAIYFFNAETNELIHTKYLGHTNPVEISSFFKTDDEAFVIVGKTWVDGRFQRIISYKIRPEEL